MEMWVPDSVIKASEMQGMATLVAIAIVKTRSSEFDPIRECITEEEEETEDEEETAE